MKKIILLRHGQSIWNQENRFTGWTDVPLTEEGRQEARQAGQILKEQGLVFSQAFTSYLSRAIETLNLVLQELGQEWLEVHKTWRLNEKHYGLLQGLNKTQTAEKYGLEQVKRWRRGYDAAPPALDPDDERNPFFEVRYQNVPLAYLPRTESLKDTVARILPYWQERIFPLLEREQNLLVVAHGNSLRAILKHIKNISEEEIINLNLPTGIPYVLEFDNTLYLTRDYFLADPQEVQKRIDAVARQAEQK